MIGWFMFLNCGIPLQSYREQHVNIHHRFLGTSRDWTSPWSYQKTVFPTKPINKAYYIITFMILSMMECGIIYARKPLSKSTFRFLVSMLIVGIAMTALALHDFFNFAFFYGAPWLLTYIYLAIASWKQHVNCDYTSVYTIAMNDFNIDSGVLGFNIGYHTAHHWYPTLHWSLLQEFHHTFLAPYIPLKYYTPSWFSWRKKKP
jgi:fatty acid desaturase